MREHKIKLSVSEETFMDLDWRARQRLILSKSISVSQLSSIKSKSFIYAHIDDILKTYTSEADTIKLLKNDLIIGYLTKSVSSPESTFVRLYNTEYISIDDLSEYYTKCPITNIDEFWYLNNWDVFDEHQKHKIVSRGIGTVFTDSQQLLSTLRYIKRFSQGYQYSEYRNRIDLLHNELKNCDLALLKKLLKDFKFNVSLFTQFRETFFIILERDFELGISTLSDGCARYVPLDKVAKLHPTRANHEFLTYCRLMK